MSFMRRMMKQTATYWGSGSTPYDAYGDANYAAPITLTPNTNTGVRWEQRNDFFVDTKTGDQSQSRAVVWSDVTLFAVDGYLFLGTSVAANPETVIGADRIRHVEKIPDVKNRTFIYKAML